mgnify:CR=1 FL=1
MVGALDGAEAGHGDGSSPSMAAGLRSSEGASVQNVTSVKGFCLETNLGGDCHDDSLGSWKVPARLITWHAAEHFCIQRCFRCERCTFVSLSLRHHDCSWFDFCDFKNLKSRPSGFRTYVVKPTNVRASPAPKPRTRRARTVKLIGASKVERVATASELVAMNQWAEETAAALEAQSGSEQLDDRLSTLGEFSLRTYPKLVQSSVTKAIGTTLPCVRAQSQVLLP